MLKKYAFLNAEVWAKFYVFLQVISKKYKHWVRNGRI